MFYVFVFKQTHHLLCAGCVHTRHRWFPGAAEASRWAPLAHLGSPGLSCTLLGSSGLSWALLGSFGLHWARMDSSMVNVVILWLWFMKVAIWFVSSMVAQTIMHRRRHSTNVKCPARHRAGFRVWVKPWALESWQNFPLKGWELHSALDRIQKKTKRLLNYVIIVVVVVDRQPTLTKKGLLQN